MSQENMCILQSGTRARKSKLLSAAGDVVIAGDAPKKTRKKRGEGAAAVGIAGKADNHKASKKLTASTMPVAKTGASDTFDDLIQLEQENLQLRKALAEKLRSENADLRKKLAV